MSPNLRPVIEHPPYFTRVTGPADTTVPIPSPNPERVYRIACDYGCTSNEYVPNPKKQPKAHPFAKFIKRRNSRP